METSFRLPDLLYHLHADPQRGALPGLIWPYKWVCTAEQGMVFFHNLESQCIQFHYLFISYRS